MVIEAYSTTKPALPFRGLTFAVLLLAVSAGLAAELTWRRGERWAADRLSPPGWDISFRLPRGFVPASQNREGTFLRFQQSTDGAVAELSFWKMDSNDLTEVRIAERILRDGEGFFNLSVFGPPPQRSVERMGSRRAIELSDPDVPMIVRAIALENGKTYAAALRLTDSDDDAELYHLFDRVCRSIQFGVE